MGVAGTLPLTAAEILAAITDDSVKWDGADLDVAISSIVGAPAFLYTSASGLNEFRAVVGTWAISDAGTPAWIFENSCLENTATNAQNDEVALGNFYVPASGTYHAYMKYVQSNNTGKAHFLINDTDEGEIDTYGGATVQDSYGDVTLGTLTQGVKAITVKVSDKNASSSNYYMYISQLAIVRT